jgi:RNA polymerase sigma factor (sigma-70 family)
MNGEPAARIGSFIGTGGGFMSRSPGSLLQGFLRALGHQRSTAVTDGQLLERFLGQRDEAAFTELMRRHGAMVLGVCQRILADPETVEDSFQATFLVLVRRGPSLTGRPVVGDWLHGVARRVALKARATAARRRQKEQAAARSEVSEEAARNDWLPLLDEALSQLPPKYRLPLVLCDLEERTRQEAAAQLGWPEGTVAGRLVRGRALLARRLLRRVQTVTGTLTAAVAGTSAQAALPPALEKATIDATMLIVSGTNAAQGALSAEVLELAQGVTDSMFSTKWKFLAALLVVGVVCGIGLGAVQLARSLDQGETPRAKDSSQIKAEEPPKVVPSAAPRPDEGGLVWLEPGPDLREALPLPPGAVARLGRRNRPAKVLAFSRDGRRFVTAHNTFATQQPSALYLWDTATARPLHALPSTETAYMFAVFSPDGQTLAAGGMDNWVYLWDVKTGQQLKERFRHKNVVYKAVFTPNGKTLVVGSTGLRLWDVVNGKELPQLPGTLDDYYLDVQLSPDGQRLVTLTRFEMALWDLPRRRKVAVLVNKLDSGNPHIAFTPDSKELIVSRWIDGQVKRWSAADGKPLTDWQKIFPVSPRTVVFAPNGKLAALGGEHCNDTAFREVRICDLATGKEVSRIRRPDLIASFPFTPDSKTVAVGTEEGQLDFFAAATGQQTRAVLAMPRPVLGTYFTSDRQHLVALTADGLLHYWGLKRFEEQKRGRLPLRTGDVPLQLAPGGQFVATANREGTLRVWDTGNGRLLWTGTVPLVGRKLPKEDTPAGPDPLLPPNSGPQPPQKKAPAAHKPFPTFVLAFTPDGTRLAARTGKNTVHLWATATGALVRQFKVDEEPYCVALSPRAKTLFVGNTHTGKPVQTYDGTTGQRVAPFALEQPPPGQGKDDKIIERFVDALRVSPDGTTLVVVERTETTLLNAPIPAGAKNPKFIRRDAQLWDLTTRKRGDRISFLVGGTTAFSGDSKMLAVNRLYSSTWPQTPTIALWDVGLGKQITRIELPNEVNYIDYANELTGIAFSPDSRFLATHAANPTILLWDVGEMKKLH